ncbi:MAG TPA: HD domain-containing protein [Pirellulales bacterium]|nr:HD domain-containing protein [Pirellulales bacterium]
MEIVHEIADLFREHGASLYGGEAVTQQEHAVQAAWLAEQEQSGPALITAALLHDIGHLLHDLPDDAPDQGIDDHHENSGYRWLTRSFDEAVTEPVRLHVAAKRYLCTVDPSYSQTLSPPSVQSLRLQGGEMTDDDVTTFEQLPHAAAAVRLRRWDDAAKVPGLKTPSLEHFLAYVEQAARSAGLAAP